MEPELTPDDEIAVARARAAEIARGLCDNVGEQVARMIEAGAFPSDWDGHEVRALLADQFAGEVSTLMVKARNRNTARWRQFKRAAVEGMSRRHEFGP